MVLVRSVTGIFFQLPLTFYSTSTGWRWGFMTIWGSPGCRVELFCLVKSLSVHGIKIILNLLLTSYWKIKKKLSPEWYGESTSFIFITNGNSLEESKTYKFESEEKRSLEVKNTRALNSKIKVNDSTLKTNENIKWTRFKINEKRLEASEMKG